VLREAAEALQYPWRYSAAGTVHEMAAVRAGAAARVLGSRNAGRGASPTAGKREGISY